MGKYILVKKIAITETNTVWMAELKSNSRRIIIKVLRKQDLLENELAHLKNHKEGLQALKSADFIEM